LKEQVLLEVSERKRAVEALLKDKEEQIYSQDDKQKKKDVEMKEEIEQLQRDKELVMAELQSKIENLRREEKKMQKHQDDLNRNT
jgi:ribosomal protein S1